MKVPSLPEVYKTLDNMCVDGKMDLRTQQYYAENGNHDVILTAADMLWADNFEVEDFIIGPVEENITIH